MKAFLVLAVWALLPLAAQAQSRPAFAAQIAALEREEGGQIGVAAFNSATGAHLAYRADARFALCSTYKLLLVAAVLARVDAGRERLDRPVAFDRADIESHAPVAQEHLGEGRMSVAALAAATMEYSDNTAANLLLREIGGPAAFTRYIRSLGDPMTRLDRTEPALNANLPGDPRDTTTPSAMVADMRKLLLGDALAPASRRQLIAWMMGNSFGGAKIRAGVNPGWKVGDRTGLGERGASSDVAIVWPKADSPFLVAVYYTGATGSDAARSKVIADVGRIVSDAFYPRALSPGFH